ncbi:hypothetical protein M0811_04664 [Anaeramoeba ignava]|uniref:Uncharacterized protein n=1 Tax=Anaeramoeba ignava TaxID=1746090 RepID=A0A9Q0RFI9_ANAIG|nr:hypothetical protein M0811_04664 [Anaeramoeba ignava]
MIKAYFQEKSTQCGVTEKIGLHFIRVTSMNRLVNKGISDEDIMKIKSGYKSSSALQTYKRISLKKEKVIDQTLNLNEQSLPKYHS